MRGVGGCWIVHDVGGIYVVLVEEVNNYDQNKVRYGNEECRLSESKDTYIYENVCDCRNPQKKPSTMR